MEDPVQHIKDLNAKIAATEELLEKAYERVDEAHHGLSNIQLEERRNYLDTVYNPAIFESRRLNRELKSLQNQLLRFTESINRIANGSITTYRSMSKKYQEKEREELIATRNKLFEHKLIE